MAAPVVTLISTTAPANGSSLVLTSTGVSVGDLLIAHYTFSDATDTMNTLAGWTHEISNVAVGNTHTGIQWKVADAGDAAAGSFTFSLTGASVAVQGGLVKVTGYISTDLLNDNRDTVGNSGSPSFANTVTPLSASTVLIFFLGVNTSTAPAVSNYAIANNNPIWTELYDIGNTNSASAAATATYNFATATGNSSATVGGDGTQDTIGIMIAISAPVSVTISPSVLSMTMTVQAPTVTGGATVSPAVVSVTVTVQAPTVSAGVSKWTNTSRNAASATNTSKHSASATNTSKSTPGSITNTSKS